MAQVSSQYPDHFGRVCYMVVADSVSLHFEFGFMNGSVSSQYSDHFGRVCYMVVPDWVLLRFEFSFMNGSSFELCSDHFGAMLAVRQELESQVQQARCLNA